LLNFKKDDKQVRWAKSFCLALITFVMKHIMLRAIFHFLNVEFVCSVDKRQPLSEAQERSLDREGAETIKYKFRFAP